MSGCQDYRTVKSLSGIRLHTDHFVLFQDQGIHTGFKMHFTATTDNLLTDIFYHPGELVRTDMRMGIGQNRGTRSVLAKNI